MRSYSITIYSTTEGTPGWVRLHRTCRVFQCDRRAVSISRTRQNR